MYVALACIIVNETSRYPALGNAFYAMAPGRTIQKITCCLTEAKARREFVGDAPGLATEINISSVVGKFIALMLFTLHSFAIDHAQIEAHVDKVVRTFLKSYAVEHRVN